MNTSHRKKSTPSQKSKSRKNKAAAKIQTAFRNRRQKRLDLLKTQITSDVCSLEPIEVKNENLFMYLEKDKDHVIPLFNIFSFKSKPQGIQTKTFFEEFYNICFDEFDVKHHHYFNISLSRDSELTVDCIFSEFAHPITKEFISNYETKYLTRYFIPYIYFILANAKIDLVVDKKYNIYLSHPTNKSPVSGFHKDQSVRTCLTYVNSPVSTELSFDVDTIDLDWLTCSPLFRFNTTRNLYTLCFNDDLILHTVPLYEDDKLSPSKLNPFEEYETFRIREEPGRGKVGVLGVKQLASEGRDVYQLNEKGELLKLEEKERVNSRGESLSLDRDDSNRVEVLIPNNRKKIRENKDRRIIVSFITNGFVNESEKPYPTTIKITESLDVLFEYKINSPEERIKLTNDAVKSILTENNLGKLELTGGR